MTDPLNLHAMNGQAVSAAVHAQHAIKQSLADLRRSRELIGLIASTGSVTAASKHAGMGSVAVELLQSQIAERGHDSVSKAADLLEQAAVLLSRAADEVSGGDKSAVFSAQLLVGAAVRSLVGEPAVRS